MVPHTRDGRVMFAIPWHGHTVVGTTDTPIAEPVLEPRPLESEIGFILETAALYLHKAPTRADVLSVFAGIRPLVRRGDSRITAALSRDHTIHIDSSGLLTTVGGKWTTYRHMAEDTVDQAAEFARLPEKPCVTAELRIHGFHPHADSFGPLSVYGSDAAAIRELERTRAASRRAARRGRAVHRRAGRVGRARGDGAHGRGCARTTMPRAVPERRRRDPDGARGRRRCWRASSDATRRGSEARSRRSRRWRGGTWFREVSDLGSSDISTLRTKTKD